MKGRKPRKFFTPFGLFLFVLSLVYLVAEAVFNMQLLEVAGSVKSSPDEINRLQYFGRTVSAYGFSLLVLGLFEGSGFTLRRRRDWALFFCIAALCSIPFVLVFRQTIPDLMPKGYHPPLPLTPLEIMTSVLPCLGLLVAVMSAGRYRPQVIIALLLLAWPAMFLGQKLLIERYVVDGTTWEQRQNARYMLMLRAGLEDCVLALGDLQLCNDERGAPDMKAARIVVSALWMMSPSGVLRELQDSRDTIVESAAARGVWFSPRDQYRQYVGKIAEKRDKYARDIHREFQRKYFAPYKKASEIYMQAMDPAAIAAESEKAVAEIDAAMEEGWGRYRAAVRDFEQTISVLVAQAQREGMAYASALNAYCAWHGNCPEVDLKAHILQAERKAVHDFKVRSGYPPDIRDKDAFFAHPKSRQLVREKVQEAVRVRFALRDFTLPENWEYDRKSFSETIGGLIREKVRAQWQEKFGGKLPPGLDEKGFMAMLGVDMSLPPIEDIVLSEEDFFRKYILPGNQKMLQSMLDDLSRDRGKYPDDAVNMEEGKEYVEALYVPTISLVVSLAVVILTVLRGLMLLPAALVRAGVVKSKISTAAMRLCFAFLLLAWLAALPRLVPNPYAGGATYGRYLADARERHPFNARLLDWAVHVQPVIYRAGNDIRRKVERRLKPAKGGAGG